MTQHHHRDESARSPENNCTMYQIDACTHSLKDDYVQLNNFLSEKSFYKYIDIQEYLPLDVTKRYRFVKDLQLAFPIGIYRLVFVCIVICL